MLRPRAVGPCGVGESATRSLNDSVDYDADHPDPHHAHMRSFMSMLPKIDRLRELGYPIAAVKGPDGGYRLEAGAELPSSLFDDEQAVALAVARQIATTTGADIAEAATRAPTTIRQVMPARIGSAFRCQNPCSDVK